MTSASRTSRTSRTEEDHSRGPRTGAALVAAGVLAGLVATPAAAAQPEGAEVTYVVTAVPGQVEDLAEDLTQDGVRVVRRLDGVGMAVVEADAAEARTLARDPRVTAVSEDGQVELLADSSAPYDAKADANSMFNVTDTVGARSLWRDTAGRLMWTGKGIDVAVLDSGVSPVEGLDDPGKVVHGPDLSFDSQHTGTRHLDGFGHGTHMAGIIAGKDTGADPTRSDPSQFMGVAPDARIVNVKVADAMGGADVSQIVAGIDWVVQNRKSHGLNIRVLNLSLGTPSLQPYQLDPLSYAVEQAWHKGIVVVVSTGNDGTGTGKLLNPAQNPYVLAVGANDSKGTNPTDDDVIPAFSTRGDGVRNPDVVAHGASIQSLRVPGSFIDQEFGATAAIDERFLRGSGTSQAAAVTSGAVALLLQRNPGWTPEDVKARLLAGARRLPAADPQAQGKGMIDLRRVSTSTKFSYVKQGFDKSKGTGSLDAARGGYRVWDEAGVVLDGERDIFGKGLDTSRHADLLSSDATWTGGTWNSSEWTGAALTGTGWESATWTSPDWSGNAWTARTWAGGEWTTARTWAGGYWAARTWAARTWAARTWAAGAWR